MSSLFIFYIISLLSNNLASYDIDTVRKTGGSIATLNIVLHNFAIDS